MQSAHVNTARKKMQSAVGVPFVFLCILVAGISGQDVKPEIPEYLPPPTTKEPITQASSTTSTTTDFLGSDIAIEVQTETPTIPASEQPTITATESTTTTSTTEPTTTTSTTEVTTTSSTTEPTTTSSPTTTQREPIYPTYTPLSTPPTTTRRPMYPYHDPWNWNEPAESCYLKDQYQYISTCWGYGWKRSYSCYRCCFYPSSNFAGCSKLHQGRCWWYE